MENDTSGMSKLSMNNAKHFVDKNRLLRFANQMLKEAQYKLDNMEDVVDTVNYWNNTGTIIGIERIIKLIERQ